MGTLSVQENLMFSGHLRLPRHQYSTADKQRKVASVIRELGLEECADTKVRSAPGLLYDLCVWCFCIFIIILSILPLVIRSALSF